VQEVLLRAQQRWPKIDSPPTYVRRMVTNEYLSWRRRRRLLTVPLEHSPEPVAAPLAEHGEELWALLTALPRQQRAVLVLRYYEGLTDPEIGDVLGCGSSTVRGYASRALATLRVELRTDSTKREGAMP
jgi:RNA polymerase sigma factor (sigma-70 family)